MALGEHEYDNGDEMPPVRTITAEIGVSVVIPTLNEERNIGWVLERMPACVDEVILVDGRSRDDTVRRAREVRPDIRVVMEPRPGKGWALRSGFEAAKGRFIVMLDGDGSMDPEEISRFRDLLEAGYDFVKGSRYLPGGGSLDITRLRNWGNNALLRTANLLYRARFTDLCYGFCAFRREHLSRLALEAEGFEVEAQLVTRALRLKLRIGEVPSLEGPRRYGISNLRALPDGTRILVTVLRGRFAQFIALPSPVLMPSRPIPEEQGGHLAEVVDIATAEPRQNAGATDLRDPLIVLEE